MSSDSGTFPSEKEGITRQNAATKRGKLDKVARLSAHAVTARLKKRLGGTGLVCKSRHYGFHG